MSGPAPECPVRQEDLDCIEELGLGVSTLVFGLGCWWLQASPKSDLSTRAWPSWVVTLGVMLCSPGGIRVAKRRLLRARTGRDEVEDFGCSKFDTASGSVFLAYFLVVMLQTPGSAPGDFILSVAFLGLVPIAFYAKKFAVDVSWKWLVALMLSAETMVVAAVPPAFLAALPQPSWTNKYTPLGLVRSAMLLYTFFGLTFLLSGGLSLWRSRHPIAPTAQEPE